MTFHTHHLTPAARLALKVPGTWAWALILRMGWATTPCKCTDSAQSHNEQEQR